MVITLTSGCGLTQGTNFWSRRRIKNFTGVGPQPNTTGELGQLCSPVDTALLRMVPRGRRPRQEEAAPAPEITRVWSRYSLPTRSLSTPWWDLVDMIIQFFPQDVAYSIKKIIHLVPGHLGRDQPVLMTFWCLWTMVRADFFLFASEFLKMLKIV